MSSRHADSVVRLYEYIRKNIPSINFLRIENSKTERVYCLYRASTEKQATDRLSGSEGEFRGGAILYGYRLKRQNEGERAYLVQSQHEASAVKLIFDSFLSGKSVAWIGKELERRGYLPQKAQYWSRSSLYAILKKITYTGKMKYGDVFSPSVESLQIVSREQLEQAQKRMMRKDSNESQSVALKNQFHICSALCGVELKTKILEKRRSTAPAEPVRYEKIYYYCSCGSHPKGRIKYFSMENIHAQLTETIKQAPMIVYSGKFAVPK